MSAVLFVFGFTSYIRGKKKYSVNVEYWHPPEYSHLYYDCFHLFYRDFHLHQETRLSLLKDEWHLVDYSGCY